MLTPVESRPLLLGLEMVPVNDSGPAGRTRFAIAPPARLAPHDPRQLGVSDVILARAVPDSGLPRSIQQTLARMYGTTRLVNPRQIALFWGCTARPTVTTRSRCRSSAVDLQSCRRVVHSRS